ncbi:hypothetical protein ALQ71_00606 [Pseudomonas coronafaciens pv. striafaciens]|nr:hypothetical protein ALQ71_00606 [Pseudomonas coronafaciens pv. striafaciens]
MARMMLSTLNPRMNTYQTNCANRSWLNESFVALNAMLDARTKKPAGQRA